MTTRIQLAQQPSPSEIGGPPVEVELVIAPTLSYAMEQSGVPLIRSAVVHNHGPTTLRGAELQFELVPTLGGRHRVSVPEVLPGESADLGSVDYPLPAGRLRQVTEAERARLVWSLCTNGSELGSGSVDVEVLPFHHWPGMRAPPALLASFVTPNQAGVAQLIRRAAEKLGNELPAYQRHDPAQVRTQLEALYEVIRSLHLAYVESPASYEQTGQKIRFPDQVLSEQLGCCLDLSVLFTSCLEQMRLAPLLVVMKGHAFPAVWLIDDRFPEGLIEDAPRLRNQLELGQIVAFEATAVTGTNPGTFSASVSAARKQLLDDQSFVFALDLRACRSEFKPLSLRNVEGTTDDAEGRAPVERIEVVRIPTTAAAAPLAEPAPVVPEDVASRFRRWKDALLDLSLRNKLLNFRPEAKGAVALDIPDLPLFEDALAGSHRFELVGRPSSEGGEHRDPGAAHARMAEADHALRMKDLGKNVLHASLPAERLNTVAKELIREARVDLEEGGVSTLYAVLGVLKWLEPGTGKERLAPLILYPISLELVRSRGRVSLQRLRDEDPVANVTLIEKLRRDAGVDLGALAELATDDSGLDLAGLFKSVRLAIQAKPGFEVLEEVHLARFSFAKFLMWRDLEDNAEVLLENPVVRHVAGTSAQWTDIPDPMSPERLDAEVPSHTLPAVLDADSTQLSAVVSALRGRSFVLQGPPGTGKSQTITNLIAAALAQGKQVLFVSEKMAALEVVQRRLVEVGLGDFCLQLHSNKSNKKDVLRSLGAALDRSPRADAQHWGTRCERLDALRAKLDAYVDALHRPRPSGFTVYEASARARELRNVPETRIALPDVARISPERIQALKASATDFAARAQKIEPLARHPWHAASRAGWSAKLDEELFDAVADTRGGLERTERAARAVEATLALNAPRCLSGLAQLTAMAGAAASGPLPAEALEPSWADRAVRTRAWLAEDARRAQEEAALLERWTPELLELELAPLLARFGRWADAFFLFAWLLLFSSRRTLKARCRGPLPSNARVREDLRSARELQTLGARLATERGALSTLLAPGMLDRGDALSAATLFSEQTRRELSQRSVELSQERGELSQERRRLLAGQVAELKASLEALTRSEALVRELAGFSPGSAWPLADEPGQLDLLRARLEVLSEARRSFREVCLYREAALAFEAAGHGALVEAHAAGQLNAAQVPEALERNLLSRWLAATSDAESALRSFDGTEHDRLVQAFVALDREHRDLSRAHVVACLERRLPQPDLAPNEQALLRRELQKKMRHLATRRLLGSIATLLPALKPCLLMSPLSVAQYLPAEARFDLVVFDEASQIGTHDAIGAIARGSQVVVVGDSKQLPPTAFFKRAVENEEAEADENDVAELESVLDEAVAKGLPQQMLGWHYRSRHDALIAFSNRHYYGDRLFVFPAARQLAEDLGVKWHPVPGGCFLSGGDRTNPREAVQLVEHLVAQLSRTKPGQRSFGVVTFSLAQRNLVEDLLDEARAKDPQLEGHFASDYPEAVFIKNLENVQGDERDEIYFSIGYAKDEQGRLRMHFGPLSVAGGERRLNVAITRARSQLRVFSTLRAEEIDLARTKALGAAHLRGFLQFAARGPRPRAQQAAASFDSEFEHEVHDALVEAGHRLRTAVGSGGYRIPLAIERPGQPGVFTAGIELDGPRWARGTTARDCERLRKEVLEGLGWKMHRVWSTEWARDSEGEMARLLDALRKPTELPAVPVAAAK